MNNNNTAGEGKNDDLGRKLIAEAIIISERCSPELKSTALHYLLNLTTPTPSPERLSAEAILDKHIKSVRIGVETTRGAAIEAMQQFAAQETAEKDRKIADLRRVMTPKERDPYIELNERNKRIDELHVKVAEKEKEIENLKTQVEACHTVIYKLKIKEL